MESISVSVLVLQCFPAASFKGCTSLPFMYCSCSPKYDWKLPLLAHFSRAGESHPENIVGREPSNVDEVANVSRTATQDGRDSTASGEFNRLAFLSGEICLVICLLSSSCIFFSMFCSEESSTNDGDSASPSAALLRSLDTSLLVISLVTSPGEERKTNRDAMANNDAIIMYCGMVEVENDGLPSLVFLLNCILSTLDPAARDNNIIPGVKIGQYCEEEERWLPMAKFDKTME
mmetsp:Transcript_25105/g.52050  ORF Transcript_25105/g.52050 Transcript_25105/m.52050 type:complete len:233 (+) Transcript_25105:1493-2191(+)